MKILSKHILHGLKTATAAVLAYALTTVLNLEFGYWAVISTVIVMQVYVADSVEMCLYRFSGTLIGALLGVLVILVIPKTPFFIGAALFLTIGLCSFLTRYRKRYRMAAITVVIVVMTGSFLTRYRKRYRMAAITVVIVVMTGLQTQSAWHFGLSRVLEIGIGILCAFAVSVTVFPQRKIDVLKQRLESQANACADKCRILVAAFIAKQQSVDESLIAKLASAVWDNHELLEKTRRHESLIYQKTFRENFALKVTVINRSVEHLRNMVRALNALDDDGYGIIMARELEKIAEVSGKALVKFVQNDSRQVKQDLAQAISDLDVKLIDIRREGLIRRFDSQKLVQVFSFYSSLLYFADDILAGLNEHR